MQQVFPSGNRIRFFHLASCQWQRGCGRKRSWKPGPDVGGSDIDKSGIAADLMYIHGHKCNKYTEIYMNCCWGGPGFRHKSSEEEVLLLLVCCCPQERVESSTFILRSSGCTKQTGTKCKEEKVEECRSGLRPDDGFQCGDTGVQRPGHLEDLGLAKADTLGLHNLKLSYFRLPTGMDTIQWRKEGSMVDT